MYNLRCVGCGDVIVTDVSEEVASKEVCCFACYNDLVDTATDVMECLSDIHDRITLVLSGPQEEQTEESAAFDSALKEMMRDQ
jgi:hypothetical protein